MFNVGRPVTGEHFYDRAKMVKNLVNFIKNGQDVMIKAPRRYGKTSLIKQAFATLKEEPIYIDLRRETRLKSIAEKILDNVYAKMGMHGFTARAKSSVIDLLGEAEKRLTLDFGIIKASVKILEQKDEKEGPKILAEALDNAFEIAKTAGRRFYIVFDEFQDIGNFGYKQAQVLEILRGTIQHHESRLCYCFLGSIETIMTEIFENRTSPFYNYCRRMTLEPFDYEEIEKDLVAAFRQKGIVFEDVDPLRGCIERLAGHPANTMVVMQNLYYIALEKEIKMPTSEDIDKAYDAGYEEVLDLIEEYIGGIKSKKHYHDVLYRLANGLPQELKGSALRQVYKGLENMGHITRVDRGEYRINDGFLSEYLKESTS
jgi:AAA+ ATPase superfamily predicted ATPase